MRKLLYIFACSEKIQTVAKTEEVKTYACPCNVISSELNTTDSTYYVRFTPLQRQSPVWDYTTTTNHKVGDIIP